MSYTPHLKSYPHYSDLYDKYTVEHCRNFIKMGEQLADTKHPSTGGKEDQVLNIMGKTITKVAIEFKKGDRYAKKEQTIREWMNRDEEYDKYYYNVKTPQDIQCITCGRLMFESSKFLDIDYRDDKARVLFFFDCPLGHIPRRAFFDNNEEWRTPPVNCSKCKSSVSPETTKDGRKITTTNTCNACGNIDTDVYELSTPKEEIPDPLFASDSELYCLSKEEGEKYIMGAQSLNSAVNSMKKYSEETQEKEDNKEFYEEASKLKKLTILELEELVLSKLENTHYVKFKLKDPVAGREFSVPFVVYDSNSKLTPRASEQELLKILRKTLEETTWRLMSEGVSYRLGILEGRLRAYEKEKELMELIRINSKK